MDEPMVKTEIADTEPERRAGPWKLIIIVIVLTLVGVWLVPGERPPEQPEATVTVDRAPPTEPAPSLLDPSAPAPAEVAAPEAATEIAAPADGVAPEAAAEIATPAEAEIDERPGARARALIAGLRANGEVRYDKVFSAAQQAQAAGELADAYLLYFFAARDGHPAAALTLGQQADPAVRDPDNSVFEAPDLTQAHKWYQVAAENGDPGARDHLADLRRRIEQLAAGGDPQAQRISLLWQ